MLEDILITEELSQRAATHFDGSLRSPNWQAEAQAMQTLARQLASGSEPLLQRLVEMAVELCQVGTAGVSLLETTPHGEEVFRWAALAGTLAPHIGTTMPRDFSPCAVCLQHGTPQLFSYPERYFTYLQIANLPIFEGLVLPLIADEQAIGTIWIVSHDEQRQFDSEDVRLMTSLADFTTTALLSQQRRMRELLAANAALEAEIAERKQAEEQTRALIENLPGGAVFVVDRDLRYLLAEGEAFAAAGFKPEDFVGRTIFEALPPELATSYEPMYRKALEGEPFEDEHHAHGHTYISRGTPLRSDGGEIYAVLVVSYDISERKRVEDERKQAEEALRESQARLQSIANLVPDLLWDSEPDGSTNWYNQRWMEYTGQSFEQAIGWGWTDAIHPDDRKGSARRYREAVEQGMPLQQEHRIRRHDGAYRWFVVKASPLKDEGGKVIKMYGAATDMHEQRVTLEALRASEAKYRSLFESIDAGFCVIEVLFDERGKATNYRFLEANPAFEQQTGLVDAIGRTMRELAPQHEAHWFEIYDRIALTGIPERFENVAEELGRFYDVYAFRTGEPQERKVAILFNDISERKQAEQELTKTNQLLQATFDNSLQVIQLFKAVRDEHGDIADFEWLLTNKQWNDQWGKMAGKRLLAENPAVIETGLFDMFKQVTESGVPITHEHYYAYEQFDGWFFQTIAQVEDGFLLTTLDITDRKQAEERLRRAAEMDAFRVKLSDAIRPLTDPDEIIATVSETVGRYYNVGRCGYAEVPPPYDHLVVARDWTNGTMQSLQGSLPLVSFGDEMIRQYRTGQTVVGEDAFEDARNQEKEAGLKAAGSIRSSISAQLIKQGNWVASFYVQDTVRRSWTQNEVDLMEEIADRTWAAVERARAEAALRELEIQRVREQFAREQERQRAESLAELDRAKTNFFSNISHEFRTPLTLMLAPLQEVLSDDLRSGEARRTHPLDPIHRERLELVHRNSLRLLKLVNTLLDFSRIEAERAEAAYEPTDLAIYTAELASVFRSAIERAGLQLIVDCPPLPEPVFVDREMWEKIVLNLLSNAFKFTFAGEITVSLRAASRAELQALTANVGDLAAELQSLSSDLKTTSVEQQVSTSKLDHSSSKLETLTSELETSSSELKAMPAEQQAPTLELKTSSSEPVASGFELDADASQLSSQSSAVSTRPSQFAILKICDTGTGIAAEHLPHLFERFYQVRGTQARTHEGSGIGLALVHELVRLHGSTIEVNSTLGEGTCFTIALPFGTDHLPSDRLRQGEAKSIAFVQEGCLHREGNAAMSPLRDHQPARNLASIAMRATVDGSEAERWLSGSAEVKVEGAESTQKVEISSHNSPNTQHFIPNTQHCSVLLIDDNADMREYLTRILSKHVQVEAVADGATALAVAQARVPDLILSDVMMPGLDGFGLLQSLRSNPCTREVPIILLSARAGEEAIVEGLAAGADDYLIKPFSAQELISRVKAHLHMSQLRGEALQQERILNRQKDELISVVSHELNTPLVSILGWTRMLRSHAPSPAMLSRALDMIERNATLQAKLVQDLLDLPRITAGKLRLNPQPVELKSVIEIAIATVAQSAVDKGIHLTWQETVTEPAVMMGDGIRLEQVICNLLNNAIKFTPESGSVTLDLSVVSNGHMSDISYAEICVIDTGIGIAVDFLPYVFDRFRQAEDVTSTKGLGLGLAIARHLVELHNGIIQAESAGEGQGATFTVRLPLLRAGEG